MANRPKAVFLCVCIPAHRNWWISFRLGFNARYSKAMEEKPKKTIASLGSIADSIRRSSVPQNKYTEPERVIEIQRPYFPPAPPKPISIRLDNLRRLDEDALMKLLTKEVGDDKRPLNDGTKMAITMELMRRQAKRPA